MTYVVNCRARLFYLTWNLRWSSIHSSYSTYIGTRFSWSYLPGLRKGPHAEAEAVVDVNYQLFQLLAGNQFCISCSLSRVLMVADLRPLPRPVARPHSAASASPQWYRLYSACAVVLGQVRGFKGPFSCWISVNLLVNVWKYLFNYFREV